MKYTATLVLATLLYVTSIVVCPDHGTKSTWTGNKKYEGNHTYCQYEHPVTTGGTHKFWDRCD